MRLPAGQQRDRLAMADGPDREPGVVMHTWSGCDRTGDGVVRVQHPVSRVSTAVSGATQALLSRWIEPLGRDQG
jgi:hypothetical protein